jgi:hypothetical protein
MGTYTYLIVAVVACGFQADDRHFLRIDCMQYDGLFGLGCVCGILLFLLSHVDLSRLTWDR